MAIRIAIGVALSMLAIPAQAATLSGAATIIDGDSLEVQGSRVRLFGIDAPEATQTCNQDGQTWTCGRASADRLQELIAGNQVTCGGNEVDMYGRLLAVCTVSGVSLNRIMVAEGWATAYRRYSQDYVADELSARAQMLGLWSSNFQAPEDYRMAQDAAALREQPARPPAASSTPVPACAIKGNHSRRGDWIYHLPGTRYYDVTRAEAWFCTEAEARAAGYRRSKAG